MASATRGAEEEVFETPDVAEDGLEQHSEAEIPNPALSKTSTKVWQSPPSLQQQLRIMEGTDRAPPLCLFPMAKQVRGAVVV